MHWNYLRYLVIVLGSILLCACGTSQSDRTEVGKKILADSTLFPNVNSQGAARIIDDFQKGNSRYSNLSVPVGEPQPAIEDITRKYGKPDEVITKTVSVPFYEDLTIHYYGVVGFAIETDVVGNKVTKIFVGK